MLTFTIAISCLTTCNLPWFMDLTFQVPMLYCSLQHLTLLPSPVASTTGRCFCFDSASSFFLELFLHSSPVAYWAPTYLRSSSFSIQSFCFLILFTGFSRQEYWSGLPFPSPVDQTLSPSTTTCSSWVTLHTWLIVSLSRQGCAPCVTRVWSKWSVWLVFCDCGFHSVCPLTDKDKRLVEVSWWEGMSVRKSRSCSDGWDPA